MRKRKNVFLCLLMALSLVCNLAVVPASAETPKEKITLNNLPAYSGEAYVELNNNLPGFKKSELTKKAFEKYSDLDDLGRCGAAYANVCKETMPTEERGAIGMIKPSGWHTVKYDNVDGKYLYNRCHLIGKGVCFNVYCYNVQPDISINYTDGSSKLSDGTITSVTLNYTKYSLKVGQSKTLVATVNPASSKGTVKWYSSNNKIATVSSTGKVTAKKAGTVTITAKTSNGLKATCKVTVKGKTDTAVTNSNSSSGKCTYVLNTNTKKFHLPSCSSVDDMKEKNKKEVSCSREEVIKMGYEPCKRCNP